MHNNGSLLCGIKTTIAKQDEVERENFNAYQWALNKLHTKQLSIVLYLLFFVYAFSYCWLNNIIKKIPFKHSCCAICFHFHVESTCVASCFEFVWDDFDFILVFFWIGEIVYDKELNLLSCFVSSGLKA